MERKRQSEWTWPHKASILRFHSYFSSVFTESDGTSSLRLVFRSEKAFSPCTVMGSS